MTVAAALAAELTEQAGYVGNGDLSGEQITVVHHASEQRCLAPRQRYDLLLDRVAGHEAVDHHRLRLAEPMAAVDCLSLDGRVPPRVEHEHVVRFGQVEAGTASLQADQKHRGVTLLEGVEHFL